MLGFTIGDGSVCEPRAAGHAEPLANSPPLESVAVSTSGLPCEYERCGTTGKRTTRRIWRARSLVTCGTTQFYVCEHCAILLEREARIAGVPFEDEALPTASTRLPRGWTKKPKQLTSRQSTPPSAWVGNPPPEGSQRRTGWDATVARNKALEEARSVERAAERGRVQQITEGRRRSKRRRPRR